MSGDVFSQACHAGALVRIEDCLKERIKRMSELADKIAYSAKNARAETGEDLPSALKTRQQALEDHWPDMEARLIAGPPAAAGSENRDAFLQAWEHADSASGHSEAVRGLNPSARKAGTAWLQEIVESASALWTNL